MAVECPLKSAAELASISDVHPNTLKQAKAVQTKAAPEVVEAVKRGEIELPQVVRLQGRKLLHNQAPRMKPGAQDSIFLSP